jgi:sulfonate transport system substrate-binding protein
MSSFAKTTAMKSPNLIRLGGVPEHFFYPWKKWLVETSGSAFEMEWNWTDYPGGSGEMIQALNNNELDFAFLLTESAHKAISNGADLQAFSVYVQSPLLWGIFSGKKNPLETVEPVEKRKYAISRFGSGSELMAMVDARTRGAVIEQNQWVLAHNLKGAEKALTTREADLFFWEKWTTKPLVDKGIFKMVDVCPSPWASFILSGRKEENKMENRMAAVKSAFEAVTKIAAQLKTSSESASVISSEYHLKESDAADWLLHVEWVKNWTNPEDELKKASDWFNDL